MTDRGNDVTLRMYEPDDLDAVVRITKGAWTGVTMAELRERRHGVLGGRGWADHKSASIARRCERHPDQAIVAHVGDEVVGYATFAVTDDGEVGVVGDNAVDPAWQGRGIGTQLIGRVIEILKESRVRLLAVSTFEHDAPARKVYERHGFEEIGKTVHYTRKP